MRGLRLCCKGWLLCRASCAYITFSLECLLLTQISRQVLFIISPSFFLDDKPIFAARFYLFLNIILHVNLMLVLSPELEKWMEKSDPAFDFSEQDAWMISYFSLIAPVVSFICWRSWTQTIWWCSTAILSSSVRLGVRGIKEGDLSIENLEKLKYEMKGA